jgi:magnesium-transporting ATPase (P-type)
MYEGETTESGFPFFKKFGTWILIMVNMVPISMMISKELVQVVQGNMMGDDLAMFDEE